MKKRQDAKHAMLVHFSWTKAQQRGGSSSSTTLLLKEKSESTKAHMDPTEQMHIWQLCTDGNSRDGRKKKTKSRERERERQRAKKKKKGREGQRTWLQREEQTNIKNLIHSRDSEKEVCYAMRKFFVTLVVRDLFRSVHLFRFCLGKKVHLRLQRYSLPNSKRTCA